MRNEAQTRFELIDPMLIDHCGWRRQDIRIEQTAPQIDIIQGKGYRRPSGRTDYLLCRPLSEDGGPIPIAIVVAQELATFFIACRPPLNWQRVSSSEDNSVLLILFISAGELNHLPALFTCLPDRGVLVFDQRARIVEVAHFREATPDQTR